MTDALAPRLFLAWTPPIAARDALAQVAATLRTRERDPGIRWIAPEQVHMTLRFLGNAESARSDAIAAALAQRAPGWGSAEAHATEAEWWPGVAAPRVLIVHCESGGRLEALGSELERLARECGFAPERRTFRPHLTLARARGTHVRVLAAHAAIVPLSFAVEHVALMRSEPGPGGSRYFELARWPLAAEVLPALSP